MENSIATTTTTLDFLSGGGKMGVLIRSKDWSETPLGSPDTWPQSLRTAVSICIASNFPICISWGPQRVQIYNDGYWPITGDMHPKSMGQDFKECWQSAWPVIGQAFEEASLGETRFLENQRIFLDRYGYKEETFFTFSFSPILDESGGIGGLFHPVIEQTQQTLAERRLNILPTLSNHTVNARTTQEASALIIDCLKDFELDLPFVLLYSIAADGQEANLTGSVGVECDSPFAPAKFNFQKQALKNWPFAEVIKNGKAILVDDLAKIFGTFNCGPYPEPPDQAFVFPILLSGSGHDNYILVAGVSSRLRPDDKCLLFYELLASSVTNILAKAKAYEEERKKAEALAEIDKAKTVFFSNISHEFRTPLTLMLSPLEELLNHEKNNFSESQINNIETTHRNAMRLHKLVNTLLDFSRIESGRQQGVFSLVDIVTLTKNLASNFRSVIEKAGLKLIIKTDTIVQPVYVDKQMWEKIVFNLLSNAFKYTLEGKITVELSAENDFAVLKVHDTGVGIPENELPKMFERFHRVQNVTARTYEGTGIGLSLIKELVQMHHGTIGVESKLNEGSVFTVKIPFGKEHLNEHQISETVNDADEIYSNIYIDEAESLLLGSEQLTKESSTATRNVRQLATILVVDDNADMRQHIRSVLTSDFNVITANNGKDALHKMEETIPALVLSDIMMPVMDGIGLLKEIRNNKATANIPVIFLTARAGEESKIEGWETGADDYLIKPFSAKELVSRVRAQIKIVKLRQSLEGNVRNLFMEAPAIICVLRGPQHVFELANEMYLQLIGKRDVLEKTVREVMPELEGQGYLEFLDNVYATGEPYTGNETSAQINKGNGKLEEAYFNFVYQPTHNSEGEIDGILMHGIDVTEQVLARKKIEESEKRFSNLLMESPFAFAILKGKDMVVALANDAVKLVWGKGSDIEGKSLLSVIPEIKEQGFAALLDEVYTTGKPFYGHEELVKLQRNGIWEDVYFNFIYQPYGEADETISGVTIIANEVTTQAIANKRIAASEQNVNRLFMHAPVLICVFRGPKHVYVLANEMYLQFIENRDVLGKPVRKAFPELEGTGIYELLDRVYSTGEPFVANEMLVRLDKGNEKLDENYFNFVYQPSRDADGKIDGVMMHGIVVTEQVVARKIIEESEKALLASQNILKENEAQLQNIFNQAPAAIALVEGPELKYRLANQAYEQISNRPAKQLLGKSIKEVFPEVEEAGSFIMLYKAFNSGETFRAAEYAIMVDIKNNGIIVPRVYDFTAQPLKDDFGKTHSMLFVAYDITEQIKDRKKIEENEKQQAFLLKLSDALRPLNNPVDIEEAVTKIAMDFMDADWCHYATIEEDNLIIQRGASSGDFPSVAGVYSISSYALFKTVLDKGYPFIVDDVHTTDIFDEELKQLCIQLQNIAFINVPVVKNGKPVGMLSIVQSKPRKWTEAEVELTIQTAERTWAAVERAKAEQALRKSEEKYRTLFASIDQGFVLCELVRNKEGKGIDYYMLELNPTYEKQTGLSIEMVLGKTILQVFPTMDQWLIDTFAAVVINQLPVEFEYYFKSTNRWHEIKAYPGEKDRFTVLFSDITERKQTEQKIKESESRFRTMADASPVLIWTLDANGLSSYYNKTFLDFIGVSKNEDIIDWQKIVHPDDVQFTFDTINTAIAEHRSYSSECRLLRADGQWRWVLAQGNPNIGANNEFLGFIGSSVDITERKQAEEKIKESESRFRILADQSPMIIYLVEPDAAATMSYFNKTWLDYTGQTFDDAIGRAWDGIVHPDDLQGVLDLYVPAYQERKPYTLPAVRLRRHDGEYRWHLFKGNPRYFHASEFIGYIGVGIDIHEQKIAEEKIKASEARYKSLIAAAPIGIGVFIGRDLILESANRHFIDLIGKGNGIEGKRFTAIMPELVGQPYLKILDDIFTTGESYQSVADPVSVIRNGILQHEFYDIDYAPLFDGEGKVYAILNIATDVTAQTQFNNKIKASEEKFKNVLLQSPGPFVILKGPEMVIDFVNESLLHSWGRTNDIVGKTMLEALPEIKDQAFPRLLAEVYKTGETYFGKEEKAVIIKAGEPEDVYYNYVYQPIVQEEKTISGITIMAIDITEQVIARKKIEESEKILEQKIIERTEQLNEKNSELQKMNKELEAFTYISSHDLQEPLRKIQTFAGRIIATEREHLSENAKDYFKRMNNAATRMQTLVQDLLAFSRVSTSEIKFEITELTAIVDELKEEFKEVLEEKKAIITTDGICEVNIIPVQFRQLMHNLISNALKFSKQDVPTHIIIKSELIVASVSPFADRGACHISVSDNGIGFEKHFSEKIFEVFQRLHSKEEFAGTGIGLAIVKKIIDNHNGVITTESELGKGATFNIYLPQ